MNLKEFVEQRSHCPICNASLITNFVSDRKQKVVVDNGELVVTFTMKALKNAIPDYKVNYRFGMVDNTFSIEFITEWNTSEQVPMHLLEKFREFHKNLQRYRFTRRCETCDRYVSITEPFKMDFHNSKFGQINVQTEMFGLTIPTENGCKIIGMFNHMNPPSTELCWWRGESEEDAKMNWLMWGGRPTKTLAPIPFVSKEETTERLNKLIIFS